VIEVAMPTRNILYLYHHQTKNTMNTTTVTISSGTSPPLIGATSCPRSICMIALEYNIVADILKSLEAIPLRITHKHIKSHQDNEERTNILKHYHDRLATHINCTLCMSPSTGSNSVTGQIIANLCLIQLATPDYKNTFSRNMTGMTACSTSSTGT
jgi:hypothetical protein